MFSPGANDPRASVPPNACDSTSVFSSDGSRFWDMPSYIKDTRLERGDRGKTHLGRRDLALERPFLTPSQGTSFASAAGRLHERHDRGLHERVCGGKRECSTPKLLASPTRCTGPNFTNGSLHSPISKPHPGCHTFHKENGRYGSPCCRAGDGPLAVLSDDSRGGRRNSELYYTTGDAVLGSRDASLVHRSKGLDACLDNTEGGTRDSSTLQPEEIAMVNHQLGNRHRFNLVVNLPRKGEKDTKIERATSKTMGDSENDFAQVNNVIGKVAVEGRLGLRSNQFNGSGEISFSDSTPGSSLNHASEKSLERFASISSRRAAFAVGNGFSSESIARSCSPLDTSLLSSQATVHSSSLGSFISKDNLSPKKKPRLGWGQGLAKYEQKKVEANTSSSDIICGVSSKLSGSLGAADEDVRLRTSDRLPSMACSPWNPSQNAEKKLESEQCGVLSERVESSYESVEGERFHDGNLVVFNEPGPVHANFGRVEASQVKVEKISTCKPFEALGFEDQIEVFHDFPLRNESHKSVASNEGTFEADCLAPTCASGWKKQDILNGIEKLELEIDMVEKELLKLDIDSEDKSQSTLATYLLNEVEHCKEETPCIAVGMEELHISKGTLCNQQHAEPQPLRFSPSGISVDYGMELESQDKSGDLCIQAVDSENVDEFIPDIEINKVVGDESASGFFENGISEPLHCSNFIKDDVLVDMQKLHLQFVCAILDENQVQSKQSLRPFCHLQHENTHDVNFSHLSLCQDGCPQDYDQCRYHGRKEQMVQRLAKRKHLVRFKEQALALKYRALKQLWRQEQVGNFHKKDRSKAFIKFESEQKNSTTFATQQSSLILCPVLSGPGKPDAGHDEVKPSKVIRDRYDEHVGSFLKMPPMVLDEKERTCQKFVSKNGLVEDPVALEQERKTLNPWTLDERHIFLEKFAIFNKNFSKIALYLEHKTTADCVVFYYKNQKCEDFQKIHRRHHLKKRKDYCRTSASYLATPIFSAGGRNSENNSANVEDISFTLANSSSREVFRHGRAGSNKSLDHGNSPGPSTFRSCISGALKDLMGTKEIKAPNKLLAVAAGGASSDIMNPCSSRASGLDLNMFKEISVGRMSLRRNTIPSGESTTSHILDDRQGNGKMTDEQLEYQWSDNEKHCFIDALSLFGKDFQMIARHIKTKTQGQCKAFFSKSRKRLNLDHIVDMFEAASQALSEADLIAMQPTGDLGTVKVEEFTVDVKSISPSGNLHLQEPVETCREGNMDEPHTDFEPLLSTEVKVLCEDEGNWASAIEQRWENSHHHIPADSTTRQEGGRTPERNEAHRTQLACQSNPAIDSTENDIKTICVLGTEDCEDSPAKVDDVKIQLADSAFYKEVPVEVAITSCSTTLKVVPSEHVHMCQKAMIEAHSPSVSSSVSPGIPGSNLVARQGSVKPSNTKVASKNLQLPEKAVKTGTETRSRREATSWTQEEKEIFSEIIKQNGKDWAVLQERLPLKSLTQIKTYFQNSKAKLGYTPENGGNGSNLAVCSRKHTSVMNKDADMSVLAAEQLAFSLLARKSVHTVENMATVNDMQTLLMQLRSSGFNASTVPSKQLLAGGLSDTTASAAHTLEIMQGQMLSGSRCVSAQQLHPSVYKQLPSDSNRQQQQSSSEALLQQLQLAQSACKQQPTNGLDQQQLQSLVSVKQNQPPSVSGCQQLVLNRHQPVPTSMQVPVSSFVSQKTVHQFPQQHASPPLYQLYSQVAHHFQQQQKQMLHSQQQLQQGADQLQNAVSPVMVLQRGPADTAHLHKPVGPNYQQSSHQTSNLSLAEQLLQCNLLNQQNSVDYQQVFSSQRQQTVLKHQQQVLIQQMEQFNQTSLAQISQHQHQLLHQQQLRNVKLQQQLHTLNQSQGHQNDPFSLQKLQQLQIHGHQQTSPQDNFQVYNYEESKIAAKQSSGSHLDQLLQTRQSAVAVQGSLKQICPRSDTLNPADAERESILVRQFSPEGSQSSQLDSEIFVPAHSLGEPCSEGLPGRSSDVKLFGQSLLVQPTSSGSKSSSASPTASGRLALRPFSPSLLASPATVSASCMQPPHTFSGNDLGTSSSLDKFHSSRRRAHQQGTFLPTNMASGTASRSILEALHGSQETCSYFTQGPVQMQGSEHGRQGESPTSSDPPIGVLKGSVDPCRDDKCFHTVSGPVAGRDEHNFSMFLTEEVTKQLDGEMENKCKLASKGGVQAAQLLSNQGLSRGVLDAIKAITSRQGVQVSSSSGNSIQLDNCGLLRSANGLEVPEASGIADVQSLQLLLHNYLAAPQRLNVSKQTISDDTMCTESGSHGIGTDHLHLAQKRLPDAEAIYKQPFRSLGSHKVDGTGGTNH